jgi:hypothetical protein
LFARNEISKEEMKEMKKTLESSTIWMNETKNMHVKK